MATEAQAGDYLDRDPAELLEDWYDHYHQRTFGIGAREAAGVLPDLPKVFQRWCDASGLTQKVCGDWGYCAQKRAMARAQLIAALGDFVAAMVGLDTKAALSVAALIVQHGFDTMCNCPD